MQQEGRPLLGGGRRSIRRNQTQSFADPPKVRASATYISTMPKMQASGLSFLQVHKNVEDNYPKLDPESVGRAALQLSLLLGFSFDEDEPEALLESSPSAADYDTGHIRAERTHQVVRQDKVSLKEEFHSIIMFKKRAVSSATLLHFAIWFSSEFGAEASIVQELLDRLEDPDEVFLPAHYGSGTAKVAIVSAVHLAAGLNQVEILKILTKHACQKASPSKRVSPDVYVSQWALMCPAGTTVEEYMDPKLRDPEKASEYINFYQPIHDSTFAGNAEVTLFLLKMQADPSTRNNKKITPLHFVAFVGIPGGLESSVGDNLSKMVTALCKSGRGVVAKADMSSFVPGATNVTPMQVAVADSSRFPQDHLGLLAPCLAEGNVELTYFDDIKSIADVTPEGALTLVRNIGDRGRENPHILRRFRINAQLEGKSDVLASIFYTAPLAASEMLELLEVEPDVEDASHHSIPAKTSLWGLFQNQSMRCTYQSDIRKKESLNLPFWIYHEKANKAGKEPGTHAKKSWHEVFLPRTRRQARSTYIKNVRVVTSLLPGVLDIDIFMAFAQCQHEHLAIMNQKTVQGAISCLWDNLIQNVWAVQVVFRFADMCAYVGLSIMVQQTGDHLVSLCWPIVAAGNIYSLATLGAHYVSLIRKWLQNADDDTMYEMWSPTSKWNVVYTAFQIVNVTLGCILVLDVALKGSSLPGESHRDKFDDALLATCLLASCLRFIWMWRLSAIGSRIYTICQTFLAGAVNQMLFITFMLLFSFIVALQVLSRLPSWKLAVDSYRGFLFGDGDGFNGVGMDIDHDYSVSVENNGSLVGFSIFGSFFFNVIVLNIIIAIYGNEYDRVETDTPMLFMQGRADYCVKNIMSCYHIKWRGESFHRFLVGVALLSISAGVFVAKYHENIWISAVLLACGQILLPMALVQCEWFSPEGQDSNHNLRYLWICHPRDWQWAMDGDHEQFEEEMATKQDQLEQRMITMDDKISDFGDKLDQLLMVSPGLSQSPFRSN